MDGGDRLQKVLILKNVMSLLHKEEQDKILHCLLEEKKENNRKLFCKISSRIGIKETVNYLYF